MKRNRTFWYFVIAALIISPLWAQEEKKDAKGDKEDKKEKTIAEVLENTKTLDGLFPLHQDQEKGTVYLEIEANQLNQKFIHFSHTMDGVPDLGLFRGQFSRSKVFRVLRHFNKIEFVHENTGFYFNPESALKRAATANVANAVLASQEIVAKDDQRFLIEADGIFLKEFFRQIKWGKSKDDKEDRFELGDLSKDRTRFTELKNFPDNTLFRVQYVYENPRPTEFGDADVADSRYVPIRVQHTLIAVPENDYQPRIDDPRVGYFNTQVTDLTSKSSAPYRDLIHRWHLKKKNPKAEVSDPVEPITWWIENTTPVELRETVRKGALAWNPAFEAAGISNAIEVKVQPDDADWDSDDIRYHVLRWTSSPDPPFGGYGPSFVNPETGQILGSDIMLEYVFLTNRIRLRELLKVGKAEDVLPFPFNRMAERNDPGFFCQFGNYLQLNNIAASAALKTLGNDQVEVDELVEQALVDLVLHEVGHTIGLNHNFRSSHLYNREQIHNKELTAKTGVIASVMDYAPANLSMDRAKQGHYYSTVPGPYDYWAVRFGYSQTMPDQDEAEMLTAILNESTKPEHAFGNDADDMRYAGRGVDPRAMINDLTSEPIAHSVDQIQIARETLEKLPNSLLEDGESYQEMITAFYSLLRQMRNAAETLSRFVGGVEVERALVGQKDAPPAPLKPVDVEQQKAAMGALADYIFAPDAFSFSPELIAKLQIQRRGFDLRKLKANEDPKPNAEVLAIQERVLDHLMHKNTLQRVLESEQYGNEYTLSDVMSSLHLAIMVGDPEEGANSFRESLQIEYVKRLIKVSGLKDSSDYPIPAQSEAVLLLESLAQIDPPLPRRHRAHIKRLVQNALHPAFD